MSGSVHIGELRTRLSLEVASRTADGGGGASLTWSEVASVWARVTPRTGSESFAHDRVSGSATHEIVIRHRDDVTPDMRFREGARLFDIKAAFDADGQRHWLTCLVEERDL